MDAILREPVSSHFCGICDLFMCSFVNMLYINFVCVCVCMCVCVCVCVCGPTVAKMSSLGNSTCRDVLSLGWGATFVCVFYEKKILGWVMTVGHTSHQYPTRNAQLLFYVFLGGPIFG